MRQDEQTKRSKIQELLAQEAEFRCVHCACSRSLKLPVTSPYPLRSMVIETLKPVDPDRRCYHQIGGVLAERTVKEVLPVLEVNRDGLAKLLGTLEAEFSKTVQERQDFQVGGGGRARGSCGREATLCRAFLYPAPRPLPAAAPSRHSDGAAESLAAGAARRAGGRRGRRRCSQGRRSCVSSARRRGPSESPLECRPVEVNVAAVAEGWPLRALTATYEVVRLRAVARYLERFECRPDVGVIAPGLRGAKVQLHFPPPYAKRAHLGFAQAACTVSVLVPEHNVLPPALARRDFPRLGSVEHVQAVRSRACNSRLCHLVLFFRVHSASLAALRPGNRAWVGSAWVHCGHKINTYTARPVLYY